MGMLGGAALTIQLTLDFCCANPQRRKRLRATLKRARLAGSGIDTGTPSGTAKPVGGKSAAENPTSKLARGSAAVADKLFAKVIRVSAMLLPAGHNDST